MSGTVTGRKGSCAECTVEILSSRIVVACQVLRQASGCIDPFSTIKATPSRC